MMHREATVKLTRTRPIPRSTPDPTDACAADQEALPGPGHRALDPRLLGGAGEAPDRNLPTVAERGRVLGGGAQTLDAATDLQASVEAHPDVLRSLHTLAVHVGAASVAVRHLAGEVATWRVETSIGRRGRRRPIPDLAHRVVAHFGDVDTPFSVHGHPKGRRQLRRGRRATFPEAARGAAGIPTRDPRELSAGHFQHTGRVGVGDVDVPLLVHGHPKRVRQLCRGGGAALPGEAVYASASERRDRPAGADLAHAPVLLVSDVDVPVPIDCHPGRGIQPGRGGRSAVPGEACLPRACERRDRPTGADFAHTVALYSAM